jgi:hypothetical protein
MGKAIHYATEIKKLTKKAAWIGGTGFVLVAIPLFLCN